jgi:hypothetical protein
MNMAVIDLVVMKKDGKFFPGKVKDGKLIKYRQIKSLKSLRYRDEYITLESWLKITGTKTKSQTILDGFKVERLYVRYKEEKILSKKIVTTDEVQQTADTNKMGVRAEKAWEKQWWKKFHPTCIPCKKDCKQSHMMLSVSCPSRTIK